MALQQTAISENDTSAGLLKSIDERVRDLFAQGFAHNEPEDVSKFEIRELPPGSKLGAVQIVFHVFPNEILIWNIPGPDGRPFIGPSRRLSCNLGRLIEKAIKDSVATGGG